MRRILLGSLLAMGLVFGAGPASGAPPASKGGGPACADIGKLGGAFHQPTATAKAIVSPRLELASDSCRAMTYTVYVLDATGTTLLYSEEVRGGDAGTIIEFRDTFVADGITSVCVYATSSAGAHIFDREPADAPCVVIEAVDNPVEYWWSP